MRNEKQSMHKQGFWWPMCLGFICPRHFVYCTYTVSIVLLFILDTGPLPPAQKQKQNQAQDKTTQ